MKSNLFLASAMIIALFAVSCDDNESNNTVSDTISLTEEEKVGLLFMLEEEKLARDTYIYMNNLWSMNQFDNIKNSEQTHMNSIKTILDQNNIDYTILPEGQFDNENLQNLYNQFVIDGQISNSYALQIGATIEDLDIVDLEDYINESTNQVLISTYQSLQCGSRNHLRSFVSAINNNESIYIPQFLTIEEYENILNGSHEQCN
ncbi:DUF2202 domain-containing protein [Flavobacterium gelidilacus]|jgi:hypothetical protein|uniref:DUF2202 domain-containing protein n=1 Tax=Flavobacterium gelidilacus TaxID=206041 RepID=UPI00040CB06A|nr:DUF2202 domain-containing protein [Flavobacterium gelidilacus]